MEILENIKEVVKRVVMLIKIKTRWVFSSTSLFKEDNTSEKFLQKASNPQEKFKTGYKNTRVFARVFAIPTTSFHHMKRQKHGIKVKDIFQ